MSRSHGSRSTGVRRAPISRSTADVASVVLAYSGGTMAEWVMTSVFLPSFASFANRVKFESPRTSTFSSPWPPVFVSGYL